MPRSGATVAAPRARLAQQDGSDGEGLDLAREVRELLVRELGIDDQDEGAIVSGAGGLPRVVPGAEQLVGHLAEGPRSR